MPAHHHRCPPGAGQPALAPPPPLNPTPSLLHCNLAARLSPSLRVGAHMCRVRDLCFLCSFSPCADSSLHPPVSRLHVLSCPHCPPLAPARPPCCVRCLSCPCCQAPPCGAAAGRLSPRQNTNVAGVWAPRCLPLPFCSSPLLVPDPLSLSHSPVALLFVCVGSSASLALTGLAGRAPPGCARQPRSPCTLGPAPPKQAHRAAPIILFVGALPAASRPGSPASSSKRVSGLPPLQLRPLSHCRCTLAGRRLPHHSGACAPVLVLLPPLIAVPPPHAPHTSGKQHPHVALLLYIARIQHFRCTKTGTHPSSSPLWGYLAASPPLNTTPHRTPHLPH